MPFISVTLPDTSQSVVRPVVIAIAGQLMKMTRIGEDVPIFYGNEAGQLQSAGSGLDNKQDRLMRSDALRRIDIKATEDYAEDRQVTDLTGKSGSVRIFEDPNLKVWIAPAYTTMEVVMEVEFSTRSKEEAYRWRADVTARYLQGRNNLHHDVEYSYNLPLPAWEVLAEVHKKREAIGGYGDTFIEYLKKHSSNQLTVISENTGQKRQFSYAERLCGIQGYFGFTNEPPKPEHDPATGLHTVRFEYRFQYQRAQSVDIKYPIIVHQQLLDRPFIEFVNRQFQPDTREICRDQWLWGLEPFETRTITKHLKPKIPYVKIPFQDDFPLTYTFPGTGTYLSILLQQPDAGKLAVNLRDLGRSVTFDPVLLDFLADGEWEHVNKQGESMFRFDLYRGDQLLRHGSVVLDKDLNLSFTIDVDVRKEYRIRCSIVTVLNMVNRKAIDRLQAKPKAFMRVFGAINEILCYSADFQKLGDQQRIYPWQTSKLIEAIAGVGTGNITHGPARTYGFGAWGTNISNDQRTFMSDIPGHILRLYRATRVTQYDQQVFGITAFNRNLKK